MRRLSAVALSTHLVILAGLAPAQGPKNAEKTLAEYEKRLLKEAREEVKARSSFAQWCAGQGLQGRARAAWQRILELEPEHEPAREALAETTREGQPDESVLRLLATKERALVKKLTTRRRRLANWCSDVGLEEAAEAQWRLVLAWDPDHEDARAALGYARYEDAWVQRESVPLREAGLVPFRDLLWVTPAEAELLEQGRTRVQGALVELHEADLEHEAWKNAWDLRSTHLHIRTNVDFARAFEFLETMERAYALIPYAFGLRLDAPGSTLEVAYCRTALDFYALTELDAQRFVVWSTKGHVYAVQCTSPPRELAGRALFEYWLQHGRHPVRPEAWRQKPGAWLVWGASFLTQFLVPDECVLFHVNREELRRQQYRYARDWRTHHGRDALTLLHELPAPAGGMEFTEYMAICAYACAFLLEHEDGRHRRAVRVFLRDVLDGRGALGRLEDVFGTTLEALDQEFVVFLSEK